MTAKEAGIISGLVAADSGGTAAKKSRDLMNRLKVRGGVVPQVPGAVDMPVPAPPQSPMGPPASSVKEASDVSDAIIGSLVGGVGIALTGELIRGVGAASGSVISGMRRKALLGRLMQRNPEFRQNKERTERYFNLVMAYAPSLARDETAITDFLRRQLQYETSSVEFIKQLSDLEGTIRGKVDSDSFGSRLSAGVQRSMDNQLGYALNRKYDSDDKRKK